MYKSVANFKVSSDFKILLKGQAAYPSNQYVLV